MVRRPTGCSVLIFIGYLFFVLALVSLYQYLNVQDNKCLMTFMYETPNFIVSTLDFLDDLDDLKA